MVTCKTQTLLVLRYPINVHLCSAWAVGLIKPEAYRYLREALKVAASRARKL